MTAEAKLAIAKQLERLKVDIIEAGFPAASEGDAKAVRTIARTVKDSIVCGLARATERDIRAAGKAVKPAKQGRIHTFIATSPIHMEKKLGMTPKAVLEAAVDAVKLARSLCANVEFSTEDAGRSNPDFLCQIIETAIKAGARTINIPDTVGYTLPDQFAHLVKTLIRRVPNSDRAVFSVHCHNDLGMAVANSLAAVGAGARQVECTINGIGERAGNAALEEIVMAVRTRKDSFNCETRVNMPEILKTSQLVSKATGFPVQPNKAIVGINAFAHESGIHQDGMLKDQGTYEIMRPEDVGWKSTKLVIGKLSGRNGFRAHLASLGIKIEPKTLDEAFTRFKVLADKKRDIYDEDLVALVSNLDAEMVPEDEAYRLKSWNFISGRGRKPSANLRIAFNGKMAEHTAKGDGLVDAAFKAVEKIAMSGSKLLSYSVQNITDGSDAQGEVTIRLDQDGHVANGHGADTDIVLASVKAYLNALNKAALARTNGRQNPQKPEAVV